MTYNRENGGGCLDGKEVGDEGNDSLNNDVLIKVLGELRQHKHSGVLRIVKKSLPHRGCDEVQQQQKRVVREMGRDHSLLSRRRRSGWFCEQRIRIGTLLKCSVLNSHHLLLQSIQLPIDRVAVQRVDLVHIGIDDVGDGVVVLLDADALVDILQGLLQLLAKILEARDDRLILGGNELSQESGQLLDDREDLVVSEELGVVIGLQEERMVNRREGSGEDLVVASVLLEVLSSRETVVGVHANHREDHLLKKGVVELVDAVGNIDVAVSVLDERGEVKEVLRLCEQLEEDAAEREDIHRVKEPSLVGLDNGRGGLVLLERSAIESRSISGDILCSEVSGAADLLDGVVREGGSDDGLVQGLGDRVVHRAQGVSLLNDSLRSQVAKVSSLGLEEVAESREDVVVLDEAGRLVIAEISEHHPSPGGDDEVLALDVTVTETERVQLVHSLESDSRPRTIP